MIARTRDNRDHSTEDSQPMFLTAIARELTNLHGGTAQQHIGEARQVLEEAFRSLERKEYAVRGQRVVHAA